MADVTLAGAKANLSGLVNRVEADGDLWIIERLSVITVSRPPCQNGAIRRQSV
jgi:hypothetical protein